LPNRPKKRLGRYWPNKFGMGWTRPAIWARPAQGQTKLGGYNPPQVIFLIFFFNIILLSKCIRLGRPRYSQIGPKKGWTDIGPTNLVWAGLDQLFGLGQHKANPNSGGGVIPSDAFHAEQIIFLRIRRKQGEQRRRRREECT